MTLEEILSIKFELADSEEKEGLVKKLSFIA